MELKPWTTDKPVSSPFALPRGLAGHLAGRLMLLLNRQRDVLDLLDVRPGASVLEVGYGPGGLIRLLRKTPEARISGVDPSPQMRDLARRRNPGADLRLGTAERTGFADAEFDRVVSVNTVALWPDLGAGLRELHRVTRPGGRVLIAWHGGRNPSRIARRLALPADQLNRIEHELGGLFTSTTRHELHGLTAFTAARLGALCESKLRRTGRGA
jgi:SAM-dependent methyltransferase